MMDIETDDYYERIQQLRTAGMTFSAIARELGVNRKTLYKFRQRFPVDYSPTDEELMDAVVTIKNENSHFGEVYVKGALRSQGLTVTRRRIRESIHRLAGEGIPIRLRPRLRRRVYVNPANRYLLHLDGNEKLQMFSIYILGCVDGFSRKVIYLKCSPNKKSETHLAYFSNAANQFGLPRFVRMDHGGENVLIEKFMHDNLDALGHERSVIYGSSVHNVRIERFWGEVNDITWRFKVLFYSMEMDGVLDSSNPLNLSCLHYVYLPRIQEALDNFAQVWDCHGIRTAHHRSPNLMFLTGPHMPDYPITYPARNYGNLGAEYNYPTDFLELAQVIIPNPLLEDNNQGVSLFQHLVHELNRYFTHIQ